MRPFVLDRLPEIGGRGGDRKSKGRDQTDNVSLKGHGNGEEYLLRRLKKHDAERGTDFAAKWARGDYWSICMAAIAAGILRPKSGGALLTRSADTARTVPVRTRVSRRLGRHERRCAGSRRVPLPKLSAHVGAGQSKRRARVSRQSQRLFAAPVKEFRRRQKQNASKAGGK
jgi:hypothetical protein